MGVDPNHTAKIAARAGLGDGTAVPRKTKQKRPSATDEGGAPADRPIIRSGGGSHLMDDLEIATEAAGLLPAPPAGAPTPIVGPAVRRVTLAVGVLILAMGLTVAAGWYLHLSLLTRLRYSFAPMQFNTAMAFVLSGWGLIFLALGRRRISLGCGALVATLGGLICAEDLFRINLGIDQLLMKSADLSVSHPGRPAPATAIVFTLWGLALVATASGLPLQKRVRLAWCAIFVALPIAGMALAGYLMGVAGTYVWGSFIGVALHTAIGLVLLNASLLLWTYRRATGESFHQESWLPYLSGVAMAVASVILWRGLSNNEHDLAHRIVSGAAAHGPVTELPNLTLVLGFALAALGVVAVRAAQQAEARQRTLAAVNHQLRLAQESLATRIRELEDALVKIKQLRGLLPICSYCKKIRNDANYWQQLESFISEQTEATFSHGICPDCYTTRVIPELERARASMKIRGHPQAPPAVVPA
jgi:hypothetical protein